MFSKNILVFYHKNCLDGFTGAWVAWKKFKNKAEFIPLKYDDIIPTGFKGKEVYLIDFVFPFKTIKEMIRNNRVILIDHHITSKKSVKIAHEKLFSLKNSGAVLAWKYFNANKSIPEIVKRVEEVDLWKFKTPHTKEIISFLDTEKQDFINWEILSKKLENKKTRQDLIKRGRVIRDYEKLIIKRLSEKNAEPAKFAGHKALVVNSSVFPSEIGSSLIRGKFSIGIVWHERGGKNIVSLRSNGKVDVSKIAKRFGGGGHKSAAGFYLKRGQYPWKMIFQNEKQ